MVFTITIKMLFVLANTDSDYSPKIGRIESVSEMAKFL